MKRRAVAFHVDDHEVDQEGVETESRGSIDVVAVIDQVGLMGRRRWIHEIGPDCYLADYQTTP